MTNVVTQSITTAVTAVTSTPIKGQGASQAMTIQGRFTYVASSATSVDVYVQTTVDGINWIDVCNFHWTTASAQSIFNVSGMTAITTPATITDGSIPSNTSQDGVLGDQWRCKYTSVGTYGAGTTFSIDIQRR